MTEQNEPSMEAILASIRNILAEDEDASAEAVAEKEQTEQKAELVAAKAEDKEEAPLPSEVQEPEQDSLPLEPEEEVHQTAPESEIKKNTEPVDIEKEEPTEEVLDLTAEMIVDAPALPEEELVKKELPTATVETVAEEEEDDDFTPEPVIPQEPMKEETLTDLIKENTSRQIADEMLLAEPTVMAAAESLSHLRDIAAEKQLGLGRGDLTIETIVRETLKPFLKEWLDRNLPEIVERVVKKEVAHVMDRLDLK